MNNALAAILAVVGGILTLAIVAVLVSPRSNTTQAISASGAFLSGVIAAAVSPVATAATNGNPTQNAFTRNMTFLDPFDEESFGQFLGVARTVAGAF